MDRGRLRERPGYRSWIIEDDYDSEYRYDSMPIASLQELDSNARVTYTGTLSKVLFPSLRVVRASSMQTCQLLSMFFRQLPGCFIVHMEHLMMHNLPSWAECTLSGCLVRFLLDIKANKW